MKKVAKKPRRNTGSRSVSRRAECIIRKWLELEELNSFFSRDNFNLAIEESGLVGKVTDYFMLQHSVDEWAAIMPLSMPDFIEAGEEAARRADGFIRQKLPDAYYFASLLVMYQSLGYALNEKVSDTVLRELEKRLTSHIGDSAQLSREGRGAPEKWNKHTLESAVKNALQAIKSSQRVTLVGVAKILTQHNELDRPLKGNTLCKLLSEKCGADLWKRLKAERLKELEK